MHTFNCTCSLNFITTVNIYFRTDFNYSEIRCMRKQCNHRFSDWTLVTTGFKNDDKCMHFGKKIRIKFTLLYCPNNIHRCLSFLQCFMVNINSMARIFVEDKFKKKIKKEQLKM